MEQDSHPWSSIYPYLVCGIWKTQTDVGFTGLTLAMVSWNLESGSRFFDDSAENWASDRKLVVWNESDKKQWSHTQRHADIFYVSVSPSCIFESNHYLVQKACLLLWEQKDFKVQANAKQKINLSLFTFLIFSILVCCVLFWEWVTCQSFEGKRTAHALKATELPGRFVPLSDTRAVPDADTHYLPVTSA